MNAPKFVFSPIINTSCPDRQLYFNSQVHRNLPATIFCRQISNIFIDISSARNLQLETFSVRMSFFKKKKKIEKEEEEEEEKKHCFLDEQIRLISIKWDRLGSEFIPDFARI